MKDQYVGDINDFLKYALLRALSPDGSTMAVAWMLTPSDQRSDGQRLRYLAQPDVFRELDAPLFDVLNELVATNERTIQAIQESAILGDAVFVSDLLTDHTAARNRYFTRVWDAARGRSLLFFDPDNGLEVTSLRKGRRYSSKYLFWDEFVTAYRQQHSLVVYQHFPRRPRGLFVQQLADRIHAESGCAHVLALTTSHVAFLICPQPSLAANLEARVAQFAARAAFRATLRIVRGTTRAASATSWGARRVSSSV